MTKSRSASAKLANFLWKPAGSCAKFYIINTRSEHEEKNGHNEKVCITLTDSPKNTISGFTSPLHLLHLGIFSSWINLLISVASKGALQSIQLCDAKLPCASTSFSFEIAACLSRVSIFCVKQVPKRPFVSNKRTNECVMVGRCLPGYSSFARA